MPLFQRIKQLVVLGLGMIASMQGAAQELTPRAYWPAPVGTELAYVGYAYQTGDIVTNPALPIVDVDSRIHQAVLGYQRTLGLWGRTSNLQVQVPWARGTTSGVVEDLPQRRSVSGFGDLSATLSVNLTGAPAMDVAEFLSFRAAPRPILAASLKIQAPTGQYNGDRLVNIGANRWAARLRLGYVQPLHRRWLLEVSVGTWFFGDNDEFLGKTLSQNALTSVDLSLVHRFSPGFWASLDSTFYIGGRTEVEGVGRADFQRASRAGFSVAYPFGGRHALKGSYSTGVTVKVGGDYDILGLTYVFLLD